MPRLVDYTDFSILHMALLKGAAYNTPLILDAPHKSIRKAIADLIRAGYLERNLWTGTNTYMLRRTEYGDAVYKYLTHTI